MAVNVNELVKRAKAFSEKYSVPLAKNQFEGTLDDPVPELPYMVWLSSHEAARGADGFNNLKAQDIDFELIRSRTTRTGKHWPPLLKRRFCRT